MKNINKTILVTGSAGFIGFNIASFLLQQGYTVVGIDNLNNYYPKKFKLYRLQKLKKSKKYKHYNFDISQKKNFNKININNLYTLIHLAAQVGVRGSDKLKLKYIKSNIIGLENLLDFSKRYNVKKIIYASSSSVYGNNKKIPTKEIDYTYKPISFYGLTKSINELQAENFFINNNVTTYGLRFFTVYGDFPRPDMAIYKLFFSAYKDKKFPLFNYGKNKRDFTHVDNIISIISRLMNLNEKKNVHKIFNIGSTSNIIINDLIKLVEKVTKKEIKIVQKGINKLDVNESLADNNKIYKYLGIKESIRIEKGIKKLNNWFKKNDHYFNLK